MFPRNTLGFNKKELHIIQKLSTPKHIQDFLDKIPINFERTGDTCMSPRRVLREWKAHCLEGALFAAAALWYHGSPPLLMNLKTTNRDVDHVVALFRENGRWGAISKTNHAVLRYREPVYASPRELAMSYFHEYFLNDGRKTLRSFSRPFNLLRFRDLTWVTAEENLWYISEALDHVPHTPIVPWGHRLRSADPIEVKAGKLAHWRK